MKSIMDKRKEYEQKKFLELSPLERIRAMHSIMSEIISLRAKDQI